MKKNILITLIAFVIFISNAQSQDIESLYPESKKSYVDYNWKKQTAYINLDSALLKESSVFLFYRNIYEFEVKEGEKLSYHLYHVIVQLNDDKAIEGWNKIYMPGSKAKDLLEVKCRVINPKSTIELDDEDIKEVEEDGYVKRYFAVRGLEKGSILEYFYLKKSSSFPTSGIKFSTQFSMPLLRGEVGVVYPSDLEFVDKKYNGCEAETIENTENKKHKLTCNLKDVKAFKEEKFATEDAFRHYIVFKKSKDKSNPTAKIEIYKNAAKVNYYIYGDGEMSKSEKKAVAKFLKPLLITENMSVEEKVKKIETEIKNKYNVYYSPDFDRKIDKIGKTQNLASYQFFRLFTEAFNQVGVEWELVATCDRTEYLFDKEFESDLFLQDIFIYVKSMNALLSPANRWARIGWGSNKYTNNYGLFIKKGEIGGAEAGIGKVKMISDAAVVNSNKTITLTAKPDLESAEMSIDLNYATDGYYSQVLQLAYKYLEAEKQKELKEAQIKELFKNSEIVSSELTNTEPEDFGKAPFTVEAKLIDNTLIEKAGAKYLIKVGELIGPQEALYSEKTDKRICNIEMSFPHTLTRKITVIIPEGYKAVNLDSLNFNQSYSEGGKELMAFKSSYEVSGNKVIISCVEFYNKAVFPKEIWTDFLRVMNSSADFNKVVLILEKI